MGYVNRHCPECGGTGLEKKFLYDWDTEGPYDWIACLRCGRTGIVRSWREPGIDKEWDYQPTIQEVEKQRQYEAEKARQARQAREREAREKEEAALQMKKIALEQELAKLEIDAKTSLGDRFKKGGWGALQDGFLYAPILGLISMLTVSNGASWAVFKLLMIYSIIILPIVFFGAWFLINTGKQDKAKKRLKAFKKEHHFD